MKKKLTTFQLHALTAMESLAPTRDRATSPGELARVFWPDSPVWKSHADSRSGIRQKAGQVLRRLERMGLVWVYTPFFEGEYATYDLWWINEKGRQAIKDGYYDAA